MHLSLACWYQHGTVAFDKALVSPWKGGGVGQAVVGVVGAGHGVQALVGGLDQLCGRGGPEPGGGLDLAGGPGEGGDPV